MIERSLEALPEHPEWFFRETEYGIAFVDPLSGDGLAGMAWPSVLDQDEISRTGREYVQRVAHPLHIIYASHRGAEDFDHIVGQPGEHLWYLGSAAVMALELDWKPAHMHSLSDPEACALPKDNEPRKAFLEAEIAWARAQDSLVLPFDIDGPSGPLRQSLLRLYSRDVELSAVPFPSEVPEGRRPEALKKICIAAYNVFRHPMMLGQLGFGLRQLVEQRKITPDDQVVATLGTWHHPSFTDQAGLLESAGQLTTTEIEPREAAPKLRKAAREDWHRWIVTAEMTTADMQ